jgi:hypothetical protein
MEDKPVNDLAAVIIAIETQLEVEKPLEANNDNTMQDTITRNIALMTPVCTLSVD